MADARPPVPPAPPAAPAPQVPQALQQPVQPVKPPVAPDQPVPTQAILLMPQLNWSHFKPEFSGKPKGDAVTHLLRTNNWMDRHAFSEGVEVQWFV